MAADPATAAAAAAEHGSGGLPQFDLAQWPGQMVWMLIIFGVLFLLFAKVFVPRVGGTIADREDRIAGDIGKARQLKDEAEAQAAAAAADTAKARAGAQKLALDAKAKAQAEAAAREAVEDAKLVETLAKAEAKITVTRDEAMVHVETIALDTALAMIAKLTGAVLTPEDAKSALAAGHS
jgi:F-type H+-transporting ATPase subunit b